MKNRLVKTLCLALALVMLVGIAAACGSDNGDNGGGGGGGAVDNNGGGGGGEDVVVVSDGFNLVVNVGPDPDTIDPALNTSVDGAIMIIHAFEGLYTLDHNGTPVPGAAYDVDISDDGLVYTFHLRDDLKWSNGDPLTAQDFVYSWNRALFEADYAYFLAYIEGVDEEEYEILDTSDISRGAVALDDNTLEVTLKVRTPYFLELTAFPVYFPVHEATVEANGEAWATRVDTYVSNGPYTMTEWVPGSHITYAKNSNYWNYAALGPDSIKFLLMDDDNAKLASYLSGEVKFIDDVPTDEIPALITRDDFGVESQLGTYYISYNCTDEHFSNPLLRKALTLAIDREYITREIGQAGQVNAGAFVAIGIADAEPGKEFRDVGGDYYDPSAEGFEANKAEAIAIIEELYPDGNVPTFEYLYNVSTGHQLIAEALQQMWADIGVQVTIDSQEWGTFLNTRKNGEYQIARNGWLNDFNDPMGMLDMWVTGGGNNDAHWSNAEYDSLISQAKNFGDQAERMRLMHAAEDILFDEWVLGPIYYYVDIFMISPEVDNFYSSPLGYKYFMYATLAG